MNWDAIGAIGELLGALAVFISLMYLALQVRQSTKWQQTEAFSTSTSDIRRWTGRLTENAELNDIFLAGRENYAALSKAHKSRFDFLVAEQFSVFETYMVYGDSKNLPYDIKPGLETVIRTYAAEGWLQQWWRDNRMLLTSGELIALLDAATGTDRP